MYGTMKRILALVTVCALALLAASEMSAQKYGVIGGATFTSMQNVEKSGKTGFNIGATAQLKLPLGFSVQPSLIYNSKAAKVDGNLLSTSMNVGYLELPVSVQWGPDLLLFRPFVDVTPFIGYAVNSTIRTEAGLERKSFSLSQSRCTIRKAVSACIEILHRHRCKGIASSRQGFTKLHLHLRHRS